MKAALRCLWYFFRPAPAYCPMRFPRPRLERLENRLAPAAVDTRTTAISLTFTSNQAQARGDLLSANQVDLYAVSLQVGDEVAVDVSAQGLHR